MVMADVMLEIEKFRPAGPKGFLTVGADLDVELSVQEPPRGWGSLRGAPRRRLGAAWCNREVVWTSLRSGPVRGDVKRSKGQFTYRTRVDFGKITFMGPQIYCLAKSAVLPMAPPTVVRAGSFSSETPIPGMQHLRR